MPAFADPDVSMRLCKEVAEIYSEATAHMLRLVAERLARGIDGPGWAESKLLEQHALREEMRRIVDLLDVMGPEAADRAITQAHEIGTNGAAVELRAAGVTVSTPAGPGSVTTAFARTHTRAVEAIAREAVSSITDSHRGILRGVDDVYRQVIARAAPQALTGTVTRRQAAQQALNRFADRGIVGFVDKAGARWQLESYTEMAVRTAVGRAQVQGTLDTFADHDRDLVIVSDAPQECEVCRPWEGRVLSSTGATPGYPTVSAARAAGLLHANCRHRLGLYVPGLTRPMGHTADPEGDALRQEQRYLERGVRHWKRREAAALDPSAKRQAQAKVREWQSRLKTHVDDNDLKRLRYREQITAAI